MSGAVVCFGEMLLRMSTPAGRRIADAQALELVVGGAEANVAVALAALGHATRIVTLLPDHALGERALGAIRAAGVDTRFVARGAGRMGLYFLEPGAGLAPSRIVYDRAGSAFAETLPAAFDLAGAMDGAALLHLSGITAALGPNGLALTRAAIAAARAAGVPISVDPNYRATLWDAWDSDPRGALTELIGAADILFAGHRDMALVLGRDFAGAGEARRAEAAAAALSAFPRLKLVASTARHPVSAAHHRLSARVDRRGDAWQSDTIDVTGIIDRIGTGDAFAAGVLHGWLRGGDARAMAEGGLALAALSHGVHGDFCQFGAEAIAGFSGTAGDVRR